MCGAPSVGHARDGARAHRVSGLCAVIARDALVTEPFDLQPLFAAAPHRGRVTRIVHAGSATLGVQLQAGDDPRASVDHIGALTIAFHGRLDNVADVQSKLEADRTSRVEGVGLRTDVGRPQEPSIGGTAARTVLQAFMRWREACADHLIGDFAFVIWDEKRRSLYGARDAMGVRPLHFHVSQSSPRLLMVATELTHLLASGIAVRPCESMVAELLSFDVRNRTDSLYADVHRLPGGHWMTATDDDLRVVRYWAPDGVAELRYVRDEEYAGHFFDLFSQAVADRMPASTPVAAYLSGGLDSSAVVCMGHALSRPFETFSMMFPTVPEADERRFIDAVVNRVQRTAHAVDVTGFDVRAYREAAAHSLDLPDLPSDALGRPLLQTMRACGFDAALTGAGGDYGLTGSSRIYAELLGHGDLRGLWRQVWTDRASSEEGWSAWQGIALAVRLAVPSTARHALRPLARWAHLGVRVPDWIEPSLASRTSLLDRLLAPRTSVREMPPTRSHVCEHFESGWTARILESSDRIAQSYGIEVRHPFFDRRLVEWSIALPESQRRRGRATKHVLRQAMRAHLPESVYARTDKGDFSAFVPMAVEALGGEAALGRLCIAELGWVRAPVLLAEYRRARRELEEGDPGYCEGMFTVWMALAIETWYRTMFVEDTTHG